MFLIGYSFISSTKLLLYWQCGFIIRMVIPLHRSQAVAEMRSAQQTGAGSLPLPLNCVAASVIVRIGLDEFVRIVIPITCYIWYTRKPTEF
jgi:hypothetical protein